RIDLKLVRARPDIAESGVRRFFHDISQMSREREYTLAFHQGRFDMDDVAAALRPGEPFSDADQILLLFAFVLVLGNTQVLWDEGWADRVRALLALGDFLHDLPHNVGDLALEVSHACFTCVLRNHAL